MGIDRIYKWQENAELEINNIRDFVKVERSNHTELKPAEEFALYVLRIHYNDFSASQGVYADIMGISSNRFSEYTNKLEEKGYIKKHKKSNGRSIWYDKIREPQNDWYKIPKSFIRDEYIEWKDRYFIIKLFNHVLKDVNEIHYKYKDIAKLMGMTGPTFREYRNALEAHEIIERLPKTDKNPNGGYRVDIDEMFGLKEKESPNLKPVHCISAFRYKEKLIKESMS